MKFKRFVEKGEDAIPTIEVDKWAPSEKEGYVSHAGMKKAREVFDELEKHLEEMGLLPEEYFLPQFDVNSDIELPNYSQAICYVNFGNNEGIYLDIGLVNYKNDNHEYFRFATGKTLGSSVQDYFRMGLVSAECSLMLNGRGDYVRLGQDNLMININRVDREVDKDRTYNGEDISLEEKIALANDKSKMTDNDNLGKENIIIER